MTTLEKRKERGKGGSNQIQHEFKSQHRNTQHNHNNHTQQYRNIERAHIKIKVTDILMSELPKPSLSY